MNTSENNPEDWYHLAAERLRAADVIYGVDGATWTGIELLQEAVERYLKGWLIGNGWKLERTHDLGQLIQAANGYSVEFEAFADFADDLTQQFWLQHYPGDELSEQPLNYDDLRIQTTHLLTLILKPRFKDHE